MTCPDVPSCVPTSAIRGAHASPPCRPRLWASIAGGNPHSRPRTGDRLREAGLGQTWHELQRILIVQLSQHLVRQADAVELPERVIVAVVVEILVVGLEDAPVVR